MNKRLLTADERAFIQLVASKLSDEKKKRLLEDLSLVVTATPMNDGSSIMEFNIPGYDRDHFSGLSSYGIEGRMRDADGSEIEVILFEDKSGRLYQLEYLRHEPGDLIAPDWSTLTLLNLLE